MNLVSKIYIYIHVCKKCKLIVYTYIYTDICYLGNMLDDDTKLSATMKPNALVHCFRKIKGYTPYVPPAASDINTKHIQELFSLTSHLQISVTSRFNILQKILAEYPEFRRNLGAQALIRDSVLFNMLHEPEVVQNLVRDYPLICEAASFIVDTIRKELARNSSATQCKCRASVPNLSYGISQAFPCYLCSSRTGCLRVNNIIRGGELFGCRQQQ